MPIIWKCSCGNLLKAKDEFVGRQAPCPACHKIHTIPNGEKPAEPQEDIFDAEAVEEPEQPEEVRDALPVAEWEMNASAGYAVERDKSDDPPDSAQGDRPLPHGPRGFKRRRRRPIVIDDSEAASRNAVTQSWSRYNFIFSAWLVSFSGYMAALKSRGFHPQGPVTTTILVLFILTGAGLIFKGILDIIRR